MPSLHWYYPCALLPAAHFFQTPHRKQKKIRFWRPLQKQQTTAFFEDPAAQPDKTALLAAQKAFDQFTENLFKQEAAQSLLTLHYTLADPENYGITDYDRTLGTALAEDTRRDMEDAKQVKADLDAMDTRLLSKDQLLTYTILSSYINTLLSSDGLELYDQPLSTTLGIQSQLPILLSEYTFYKNRILTITCLFYRPLIPIMTHSLPLKHSGPRPVLVCVIQSLTISSVPAMPISLTQTTAFWQKPLLPA